MQKIYLVMVAMLLSVFSFTMSSCSDDDDDAVGAAPVIHLEEVGMENSKQAQAGDDLHLEGEIVAEALIARIDIEIHQKEGSSFKIEKSFTEGKYIGVKNTNFHEHIDIPATAPAGAYHLHFTVTDQLGQQTTVEVEGLQIIAPATHIAVDGLKFGASHDFSDNLIGYVGTKPMVGAHITAENGIDKIHVFIHNEDGTPAFQIDTVYLFNGETEWGTGSEHKHITLSENAPVGDYHLHFDVYDKKGEVSKNSLEGVMFKSSKIELSGLLIGTNKSAVANSILTKFNLKADGNLHSVRIRIYKETAPTDYYYNKTLTEDFSAGMKEYAYNSTLEAKDDNGDYASSGEYVLEIRVEYAQGANKIFKETFHITE